MPPAKVVCPVRQCCWRSRRNVSARAVFTLLLLLSASMTCALSTTLEDDLHIVHNLDNRSPEIDPFWYVGRGVRPIGRFGKRQASSGLRPAVSHLELLLHSLRDKDVWSLHKILAGRITTCYRDDTLNNLLYLPIKQGALLYSSKTGTQCFV